MTCRTTHFLCTSFVVQLHASQHVSDFFVALPFFQYCCDKLVWNFNGSRPIVGARKKRIIVVSHLEKELEKTPLQSKEKGTEVDARAAELYSKPGNTDITELVVIDETTPCEECQEHNATRKSFCNCGSILQQFAMTEKDEQRVMHDL